MNTERTILRMSPELKTRLQEQAEEKGMKLSAYIRMILIERENLNKRKLSTQKK